MAVDQSTITILLAKKHTIQTT